MNSRFVSGIVILFLYGVSFTSHAGEPYCGLYSVHAALHAMGHDIDFESLLVPENLSGNPGSTASDLIHILKCNDRHPIYRTSMAVSDLRSLSCPALLHTAPAMVRSHPNHWVAFLGFRDGMVSLYDPPSGLHQVEMADLMIQWNGTAIVVDDCQAEPWWPNAELAFGVLCSTAVVILLSRLKMFGERIVPTILTSMFLSAALWHTFTPYGFFNNSYAIASVFGLMNHSDKAFRSIDASQVAQLLPNNDVTVVDARTPEAYARFHIDGAVNLPISATHGDLRQMIHLIPRSNTIIVYCQSRQCQWGGKVATQLASHGYRDIALYSEGMIGWEYYLANTSRNRAKQSRK
jgi:rhodanese-related sulfurtransferase